MTRAPMASLNLLPEVAAQADTAKPNRVHAATANTAICPPNCFKTDDLIDIV